MTNAQPLAGVFFLPRVRRATRIGAFVVMGVGLAAAVLLVSLGASLRGPLAVVAVRAGAFDGQAIADYSETLAATQFAARADGKPASGRLPAKYATRALMRTPLLSDAWRVLAFAAQVDGRPSKVTRAYLNLSLQVSRRDVPTNVMALEFFAKENDTRNSFRQLDFALRRSAAGRAKLLPIMVQNLQNPEFRRFVLDSLRREHGWRADFISALGTAKITDQELASFVQELPGSAVDDLRPNLSTVAAQLLDHGMARSVQAIATRLGLPSNGLVNPGFEHARSYPPFDWAVQSTSEYDAAIASYGGQIDGRRALYLRSSLGADVEVSRHVVFARSGRVVLSATAGTSDNLALSRISLAVVCVLPDRRLGQKLGSLDFSPLTPRQRKSIVIFVPPADCGAQWLLVTIRAAEQPEQSTGWVDSVELREMSSPSAR